MRKVIEVPDETAKQIALKRGRGVSLRDLESEFKLSRPIINRVLDTDIAKQVIKETAADIVALEKAHTQRQVAELLPMAVDVVRKKLEQGDLKAAEMIFKSAGLLITASKGDHQPQQAQTLTVILPNLSEPKEVINESSE